MSTNEDIARIFEHMADILEIQNVQWKPRAYRTAARQIRDFHTDLSVLYKKSGIKAFREISGVGEHMARKIEEYIKTNKIQSYEKLKKSIPAGLSAIMNVPGMGPKKAYVLYKKLNIKTLADLKKAVESGKVRNIKGFGLTSEEKIEESLGFEKTHKNKIPYSKVYPIAKKMVNELKKKGINKVEIAGSLRRKEATIGDIDLLAISNNPVKVMNAFTKLKLVKKVIAKGQKKSVVILKNEMQADIRVFDKNSFGAAMQYFTGNKAHNIALRRIAIKKGLKLNEYGLFKGTTIIAGDNEKDIYSKLGLKYIPPEKRKGMNEIEEAK